MEKQNQEIISKKNTKINSLKSIKILLLIQITLFFIFIATLVWYFVAFIDFSISTTTTTTTQTSSYVNLVLPITLFIISTIFYGVINLTLSILIIVTGSKNKNIKEIAIIFGILGIFFGWIFSLVYYLVAKSKIKNNENI